MGDSVLLPLSPEDEVRRLRLQESLDRQASPVPISRPPRLLSFRAELPYPGAVISINHSHYAGGSRPGTLKPAARAWMNKAVLIVRAEGNRVGFPWGPMQLRLSGTFRSRRSMPDWDNILKPLKDVLAAAANLRDDRDILSEQGKWEVVPGCDPVLILEVTTWRG